MAQQHPFGERASDVRRAQIARDAYTMVHFPLSAAVVAFSTLSRRGTQRRSPLRGLRGVLARAVRRRRRGAVFRLPHRRLARR